LPLPLLPLSQLRKKKRRLMPSLLPQPLLSLLLQHQLLPLPLQQRLPKVSLLRKTTRKTQPRSNPKGLDDSDFEVDDEITFGRNRQSKQFGKLIEDDELSDRVKFRLWLARQIALAKYREVTSKGA
jgi:hypothetical protein